MIYPLMFLRLQSEYFQSCHVSKYYCHAKHFSGWVSGFGWKHHFGVLHGGLNMVMVPSRNHHHTLHRQNPHRPVAH